MAVLIRRAGFEDLLNSGDYFLKALIIGENGSGKTPTAAQWPKPLFALCENGHMSLALSSTPYADVKSSADMQSLLDAARLESRKPVASRQYQTFVVDTIDSYQKLLIQERLRETKQEGLSGWADWGWLDAKMSSLNEQLKALAMNVVVLMHTKDVHESVDDDSDATKIVQRSRMKGDIKDSIFDNFPLVGLMENSYAAGTGDKKGQRVLNRQLRWQPDPKHPNLRDQSTRLPKFTTVTFEPSDFQQLFDAIGGGLDDYAKSEVIEEVGPPDVVEETTPIPEVATVGALDKPSLPKAAAKKAVAKKTAAKKAVAPATSVENSSPAPTLGGPASESPAPPAILRADAGDDQQVASAGEDPLPGVGSDPWQPPVKAEAPPEPPKPAVPGQKICGSQPPTFAKNHKAVEGCGNPIAPDDMVAKVSIVKFRTFLCGSCVALHSNN